jgi:hypothetical protein
MEEKMRKLATIRKVGEINPIKGADFIVQIAVDGWECVAKKDEFETGDLCVYFEVDSILPAHEVFDFMESRRYRVKTAKFKKQIAQGLAMPTSILEHWKITKFKEGDDVTEKLGVHKHDPMLAKERGMRPNRKPKNFVDKYMSSFMWYRNFRRKLFGKGSFNFPEFIPKTDEERIQNMPRFFKQHHGRLFYRTEKVDGMSATYAVHGSGWFGKPKFYVCSRNLWLWKPDYKEWWTVAKKFDIEAKLRERPDFAVQGEIIGPGCNGNNLKLKELSFKVFNVYDIKAGKRLNFTEKLQFCIEVGFKTVPLLKSNVFVLETQTAKDFVEWASGNSCINKDLLREGDVWRAMDDDHISIKAINPKYLLKHGE